MAKIYKLSDRRTLKVHDMEITVAPMSKDHREKALSMLTTGQKKGDTTLTNEAIYLTLQASLKSIKGLTDWDNNPYELKFKDGLITEECLQDLINMEHNAEMLTICGHLLGDFTTNKFDIPGVEVIAKK